MCHHAHVHVTLSAEDKAAAKKLSGIMIPVYASIVLAVIAVGPSAARRGRASRSPRPPFPPPRASTSPKRKILTEQNPPRRRRRAFDWSTAAIAAVAFAAAAAVYLRDGREHFLAIFGGDLTLFGEMLPKVLAGCLIGAFVTMILPRELVARWVGHESGFAGLAVAAFFGFLLPGGPITIYPVAGAFLTMGADAGAVVAFITAWTLLGYTRALVWELPFFGPHFVIWRIVEAVPLPIVAGLLARMVVRAGLARLSAK